MPETAMDRERQLIADIERDLPEFAATCKSRDADFVLMHQDAFAPALGSNEIFLLGKAIKYAGLLGKEVRIVPSARRPS